MYFASIKTESSMSHFAAKKESEYKYTTKENNNAIKKCIISVNDELSISPLAGYNCLPNLCPRSDFARSISRKKVSSSLRGFSVP